VIDPKPKNIACYRVQPDIIIPNADELSQITNVHVRDYRASILSVLQMTGAKAVLVTKGKEGMTLFLADKMDGRLTTWEQKEISPLKGIKSKWTAGAGDVVAAVMGLSLASGYSFLAASEFANMAAAISTEKPTTCNCSIEELRERF
jgi:bifunctional ADP-heptose synthase (sugar kinase/adenylyltransferase)